MEIFVEKLKKPQQFKDIPLWSYCYDGKIPLKAMAKISKVAPESKLKYT